MPLSVDELARRYVSRIPPAVSGQGGHTQTFKAALALVKGFDLTVDQARSILLEYNQRCEPPWSDGELEHKLISADGAADEKARGWLRLDEQAKVESEPKPAPKPAPKPVFRNDKLAAFAARWREHTSTAWLADRSPVFPYGVTSDAFLRALYQPGENVLIFTSPHSQGQALWPAEAIPTRGADGVWYLAQPVDGEVHPNTRNENKPSRRSEESVTSWRYLVLESDEADPRDWVAAVVQLPLAIAAMYTSGGRSIHTLIRVDAKDLAGWRSFSSAVRPVLVTLGADQQVVSSAVRLTRLPGCYRGNRLQKLLYLNPDPPAEPIISLPRLRDSLGAAERDAQLLLGRELPELSAAEIAERYKTTTLDGLLQAAADYETKRQPPAAETLPDRTETVAALTWFATVPRAAELLGRLAAQEQVAQGSLGLSRS